MNGQQFIRRARKWANARGLAVALEADRGKGGHQRLQIGAGVTFVKTGEIGKGLLAAMLRQLNIPAKEF